MVSKMVDMSGGVCRATSQDVRGYMMIGVLGSWRKMELKHLWVAP